MKNYIVSRISVNCFVKNKNGQFLLVRQARPEHAKGKWSVPGGKIMKNEDFKRAVVREVKEETGLRVIFAEHKGIIHESPEKTVKHIFLVRVKNAPFSFDKNEIMEVDWFMPNEIFNFRKKFLLRGDWVWGGIELLK